jgi:hypothetical protein
MHRPFWLGLFALGIAVSSPDARGETLWIPAGQATSLSGPIVLGQKTGLVEEGALGDFLVSALCVRPPNLDAGYAEYRVQIPRPGPWYLWARLRDPLGQGGSFAWIPQGEGPRADFHKRLDGFKVLVLANEACMSDEQVEAVRRFVKAGGRLVATYETSRYDEKGNPRPDFGLADVFGCHFERILPPVKRELQLGLLLKREIGMAASDRVSSLLSSAHAKEPHVAVRLEGGIRAWAEWRAESSGGKPIPAVHRHGSGSGSVTYVPGRWDALQCGRPFEAVEGAAKFAVGAACDHLVENVRVWLSVPDGSRVTRLHRLRTKTEVPFEVKGDYIEASLGSIGEYEVLVAEFTPAPGKP